MQSYLITGADEKARLSKAEELISTSIANLENSPDFFSLRALENSIGIDEVRGIQKKLSLKPFQEKQKICIIEEAQNLTSEAQNCLLKTLEEPPSDCLIILTAPESDLLLPTVVSRCLIISLLRKNSTLLEPQTEKEQSELLTELLNSSLGKRLVILEKQGIAKDRVTATLWLDQMTLLVRKIILDNYLSSPQKVKNPLPVSEYQKIINLIAQTKSMLLANVNIRLALEILLCQLPSQEKPFHQQST